MGGEAKPLLDVARGDQAQSEVLRASLKILRDKSGNPEFKSLVDDVLAGRRSLRDVSRNAVFNDSIAKDAAKGIAAYNDLSEEERQTLAAKGEAQLERIPSGEISAIEAISGEAPQEDEYEFDPDDPLRRNAPAGQSPQNTLAHEEEDEYEFDPSDPLRRRG
ncbi:hypothetical protein Srot_1944 [Segniliparus rotundus DSM 44985]|uniref:Uncharacterized protein n=1 Tax=Segniliparus rotundus (strain ATCC BAA-972 / CDC 1076 / CIP 108378 / DSM 44985 / JCM 13578) TaxID=640132 RepID=D6Z8X1_SEGRD|nr:hypothetical protein [Segniliparus rotundus]ADG98401.1 hypothetical protein Srot_1944 [Segniliparus rotundus DSM 44985]